MDWLQNFHKYTVKRTQGFIAHPSEGVTLKISGLSEATALKKALDGFPS